MKLLLYSLLLFFIIKEAGGRFIRDDDYDNDNVRIIRIPVCDSVGTQQIQLRSGVERCSCHPGFYGNRCERIFRCIHGRSINISCIHPPPSFKKNTDERCIFGQENVEVCDCFEGYGGARCQLQRYKLRPYVDPSVDFSTGPSFKERVEMDRMRRIKAIEQLIEEENERADREYLFHHLKLLLVGFLVFTAMCAVLVAGYIYFARRNRRYFERILQQRTMSSSRHKMPDAPPSYDDCRFQLIDNAPPNYSEETAPHYEPQSPLPVTVEATPTSTSEPRIAAVNGFLVQSTGGHANLRVERNRSRNSVQI